jgi:hypothetical protein
MDAQWGSDQRRVPRSTVHAVVLEPLTSPVAAPTPTSSNLRSSMFDLWEELRI